jgi:hypothetical protein
MHKNLVGESLWNVDAEESCWRQFVECECTRILLERACEMWMHKNLLGVNVVRWECTRFLFERACEMNAQESCWREFVKWECTRTLMERVCEVRMHKNLFGESLWDSETTFQLPVVFRMWLKLQTYSICKLWKCVLHFGTQQLAYVLMDAKACLCFDGNNTLLMFQCSWKLWLMFFWILKVFLCCWRFGDCIFQGDVFQWNNGGSNILNNVPSFPLDLQSPRSFRKG